MDLHQLFEYRKKVIVERRAESQSVNLTPDH
jgi:hypothetical protein